MLTVVTAATAANLTTLSRARAMLDFAPTEDEAVGTLIDQASRVIADYCRRPFGLETVKEVFEAPCCDGYLMLSRSPAVAFVEVIEGEETVAPASFHYEVETGLVCRLSDSGRRVAWSGAPVAVTYAAGYVLPSDDNDAPVATLPEPVERAAIRLVGAYRSLSGRDPLIKSETTEGIGSTSWWVPGAGSVLADPEAEQLLQPYRRLF
ncbi:hypothetical protein [Jiella avicenniae]|uniref:Phage gp6-like head-tail connector protein n=1 Tax=Jiella avicenniae TaxID=2907202 RepID=A0A9X1NZZ2_9HYPH|nr:hypothetical protein [Jiella avicenniae]MCE7028935.1 hypothetical protein [Jiella avicenniae]